MNIKTALNSGREILQRTQIPALEAELLLAHTIKKSREFILAFDDTKTSEKKFQEFIRYCNERASGKPLAHILKKKEFYGIEFYVDERALIPRPETEHLIEEVLDFARDHEIKTILDVGTGSGNIAIALARNLPKISIFGVEISLPALEVATHNVKKHHLEEKITLIHGDLLSQNPPQTDIIVANLPYIGEKKNRFISREAEEFEPHAALFGGENGLMLYEKLFSQLLSLTHKPKLLLGEIGFSQNRDLTRLLKKYFPRDDWEIKSDLAGLDRYFKVLFK